MTKILLVEDDKSLREIYGVRLEAEGYTIVSAGDGEEALAMAIKERPDLVISDVMMPKVSGFDMLDILRSTTETKNIKVIVMTALSSEEQRKRGELLGADRYLVKSQVGIEDVVRVVHEVLTDTPSPSITQPFTAPITPATPVAVPTSHATTVHTSPQIATQPSPQPTPQVQPLPTPPSPPPVASPTTPPVSFGQPPVPAPSTAPQPVATSPIAPPTVSDVPSIADSAPSTHSRVIQPIGDPTKPQFDINELLDKEVAKEAGIPDSQRPAILSIADERQDLKERLDTASTGQLADVPGGTAENNDVNTDPLMSEAPVATDQPQALQSHDNEPIVTPPSPQDTDNTNALSGTTLPPTSIQ